MRWQPTLALGLALLAPAHAMAVPLTVALTPANTRIRFRAFALSLFPMDGGFARFTGSLAYDPARPGFCHVLMVVEVASLRLASPAITADVLSRHFLDPADFPRLRFEGACRDGSVAGILRLHGVSRPFLLRVRPRSRRFVATGRLRRALWGVTARPLLAGPMVRIRVLVRLAR